MSTFGVEHGPLEREAVHTWKGLDLNDLTVWPRIEVAGRIEGYRARPDADDDRAAAASRIGEVARPSLQRGRTVTYPLVVMGRDLPELRAGESALVRAFADAWAEDVMAVAPAGDHTGPLWWYTAKPLALTPGEERFAADARPTSWQVAYTLSLRLADPRYYTADSSGITPLTAHLEDAAVVENLGSAPTEPSIKVNGPTDGAHHIELRNQDTDDVLVLHGLTLSGTQYVTVDFRARTVKLNNGTNYRRFLRSVESTWWDAGRPGIPPGESTLQVVGAASADVSWHHAAWG